MNNFSAALSASRTAAVAVHELRDLARQRALRMTLLGLARGRRFELADLRLVEEREELQILHRVAIVHVEPELIETRTAS